MIARKATTDDIPEIVRIINIAYRVEDFFVNGDRTNSDEIAVRMSGANTAVLVVDADRPGLAAAVCVDLHDERGHFAMLSVDPASQGKGLGRALVTAVENYCRDAGCTALDLEVVNLRSELPPFYEALGFSPAETAPFEPASKLRRDAHLIRMTKQLR
jgi:GNAT superfamily N-acetyltransferase